jgi:hypothetical protein
VPTITRESEQTNEISITPMVSGSLINRKLIMLKAAVGTTDNVRRPYMSTVIAAILVS